MVYNNFIKVSDIIDLLLHIYRNTITLYKLQNNKPILMSTVTDENEDEEYTCADFINFNNKVYCVSGGECGIIKVIDVEDGSLYRYILAHTGRITCIKVYGKYIITGSADNTVRMWDLKTGMCIKVLYGHIDIVKSIDCTKTKHIISAGVDCKVCEWYLDKPGVFDCNPNFVESRLHRSMITQVKYYGNLILLLSYDGIISLIKPIETSEKKDDKLLKNLIYIKQLKVLEYKIIEFEVIGHMLVCLTQYRGLFIYELQNITFNDEPLNIQLNENRQGVSMTSNLSHIFILDTYEQINVFVITDLFTKKGKICTGFV